MSALVFRPVRGARSVLRVLAEPRFQICICCFLAVFAAYVERTGFSIAYTAMCEREGVPERVKGTVLSSFFWGYAVSQVPGGWLAQRFGGRITLMVCFASWSTICALMPLSADHTALLSFCRMLIGVSQGLLIPSVHTVLSEWVLPHERAKATSLVTSGMYLGSAAAMQLLPPLAAWVGTPTAIVKLNASVGFAWLALWSRVGREVKHRDDLIPQTTLQGSRAGAQSSSKAVRRTPWAALLRHPAVWAIVLNNFTFHYSFYLVMNWLPTYFSALIGVDLAHVGLGKPVPYLVMFAMSNVGGWLGDALIARSLSVAAARKTVNCLGFWGTALGLLAMPYATTVTQGLVLVSLCLGFCGLARGGFSVNHMDIAPRYAGVLMGISNTAGTVSGIIGVALTGYILELYGGSAVRAGWFQAHLLAVALGTSGSLVFLAAAKGERLFG